MTAVILGVLIAAFPMVTGFASGIRLQGSLNWGMSVIQGSISDSDETVDDATQGVPGDESSEILPGVSIEDGQENQEDTNIGNEIVDTEQNDSNKTVAEKVEDLFNGIVGWIKDKLYILFRYGYRPMYGEERAVWMASFTAVAIVAWAVYRFLAGILQIVLSKYFIEIMDISVPMR